MEKLMEATTEQLVAIEGFGEIVAQSVVSFLAAEENQNQIKRLEQAGINMESKKVRAGNRLRDKPLS